MRRIQTVVLLAVLALIVGCSSRCGDKDAEAPLPSAGQVEEVESDDEPEQKPQPIVMGREWVNVDDERRRSAFQEVSGVRGLLAYELLSRARSKPEGEEFGPYALAVGDGDATRDFNRETTAGFRSLRSSVVVQARKVALEDSRGRCGHACTRGVISQALEPVASGLLWKDGDANVDVKVLQTLLSKMYVQPDANLLGVKASDVYRLLRGAARQVSGLAAGLEDIGLDNVREAYKTALAEHPDPDSGVNRDLIGFYRTYTAEQEVPSRGGLQDNSRHWATVSFWMRRLEDGSYDVLRTYMIKGLRDYDPEWYQARFGR